MEFGLVEGEEVGGREVAAAGGAAVEVSFSMMKIILVERGKGKLRSVTW